MRAITQIKQFISSSGFRKYFSNTSWLLGEKIGTLGVSFIVGAFVARYLGPDSLGILSYAQSLIIFFSITATMGIETLLPRNLVDKPEWENRIMGTSYVLRLAGAVGSFIVLGILLFFMNETAETNAVILIIGLGVIFQTFNVIDCFYQSKVLSKFAVRIRLIQFGVSTTLKLLLMWIGAPLLWFAIQILVNDIILGVGLALIYNLKHGSIFHWRFDKNYAFELMRDAWPLLIGGFVIIIYMKVDQIMIKHLLGNEATGIYSIAVKLSEIFYFIPGVICASLFPAIVNAQKADADLYKQRMQQLMDLMIVMAIGISIFITLISGFIIPFIYGEAYAEAGPVLAIHIWASVFVFMGFAASKWVIAENVQQYGLFITIVGAIINVALNFIVIPIWGIKGAAMATFISQAVASYLMYIIFPKTRPIFFIQSRSLSLLSIFTRLREKLK